jgi:eukaryotic-like serine/threonine-protein kinase
MGERRRRKRDERRYRGRPTPCGTSHRNEDNIHGVELGGFAIERKIGEGGMGAVFRALDRDGRPVAIKMLQVAGEADLARFDREAEVLASLDDPRIVKYIAHGTSDTGAPWLAMEWLAGEDLAQVLSRGALAVAPALRLCARVAEALSIAHARGVVHRDVKPSNLFVTDGDLDNVKVLDFGIARRAGLAPVTHTGTVLGTVGYMAPEQARGASVLDARCDVFALGCVLYECITGRPAFAGEQPVAILAKVLLENPAPPSTVHPGIPPSVDALTMRLLAKDPDRRPADGAAAAREIAAAALSLVGRAVTADHASAHAPLSPQKTGPMGLGSSERQSICVVLASSSRAEQPLELAVTVATALPDLDIVKRVAGSYAGHVEQLADGSLLALLRGGMPTDLAARAVRCAHALAAEGRLSRVSVVTARAELRAALPVGDVLERAARLLKPTTDGQPVIRLDELTAGLLDGRFTVDGDEHGLRLSGIHEDDEPIRTLLGQRTTCVGREREIALLHSLHEECIGEPIARAVLVTAKAGTGKSRLLHEVLSGIAPRGSTSEPWIGRADPMNAGSSFGLLARALRRTIGLREGEAASLQQQKVRARLRRHLSNEAAVDRVAEMIGEMIGVRHGLQGPREDAIVLGQRMRAAFIELIAAECASAPVIIVLEDVHWGDLPSLMFIDAALHELRNQPLFVIATARPEVHDLFPALFRERDVHEIELRALGRRASERLIRDVLGEQISALDVSRLVAQSDGHPLFLEELIRAEAAGARNVTSTVLALVSARLDALSPHARLVLRAASAYGEIFWRGGVRALLNDADAGRLDDTLADLVEREWISVSAGSRFGGERDHTFRHALFRDAAYALLTEEDRVYAHCLAGDWLEKAGERDPMTLAEQFERGNEPARALTWFRGAAEQSLEGADFDTAITRAQRGVDCGATGEMLGALRLVQSIAHDWLGRNAEAQAHAIEALALLPRGGAAWSRAACEIAVAARRLGDHAALESVARSLDLLSEPNALRDADLRALGRTVVQLAIGGLPSDAERVVGYLSRVPRARLDNDPGARAWTLAGRAVCSMLRGDVTVFVREGDTLRDAGDRSGDGTTACNMRLYLGIANAAIGDTQRAERDLRDGLELAQKHRLHSLGATMQLELAQLLCTRGEWDSARALADAALASLTAQRDRMWQAGAHEILAGAWLGLAAGAQRAESLDRAEKHAREAVALAEQIPLHHGRSLITFSRVLSAQGHAADALTAALSASAALALPGADRTRSVEALVVQASALSALGRADEERAVLAHARTTLLAMADRIVDPELRALFLARPDHAGLVG